MGSRFLDYIRRQSVATPSALATLLLLLQEHQTASRAVSVTCSSHAQEGDSDLKTMKSI